MANKCNGLERQPSSKQLLPDLRPTAGVMVACAGLRALACVGVLTGHVIYYVGQGHQDKAAVYRAFKGKPWINASLHFAEPSMDTFMVLTGFLAAISLIPALERTSHLGATIRRYYMKRALRILPAYYSVLAILHGVILPSVRKGSMAAEIWDAFFGTRASFDMEMCRQRGWMNLVFLSNQLQNGGCFNITWSLAVQVQFYAMLPLCLVLLRPRALGFRKRVAIMASCCIAAQIMARLLMAQASGFWRIVPMPAFGPMTPEVAKAWDFLAGWSYLPLSARIGALSMGVLVALAVSDAKSRQKITRWRWPVTAVMLLAAVPAFGGCFQYKIGAVHEPDHPLSDRIVFTLAFTFVVGVLCPLVPSCLLALVCTGQPGPSGLLGRLLSMKLLSSLADVSYEVYLLHPLVIYGLYSAVPPSLWFDPEHPLAFALVACLVLGLSVAAATLHKGLLAVVLGAAHASGQALSPALRQSLLIADTSFERLYDTLSRRNASSVKEHIRDSQLGKRRLACESMAQQTGDRHSALQAEGALSLQSRATAYHLQQLQDKRDGRAAAVA